MTAKDGRRTDYNTLDEVLWASAVEQARLVRTGAVSARELVQAAIDRLERTSALNLLAVGRFEQALAEAEPGNLPDGPFTGVPLLLKDLGCDQAGVGSYLGNVALRTAGRTGVRDAVLVERLRAAGFVILGRTTSPEFGIRSTTESRAFGITRNPWNPRRSTGGSSGGSAAAVSAGIVAVAQGSDGAGSLRMPATLCGVSALKPTHNLISQAPDWEVMAGHSDYGPLARHIEDLAGFLEVAAGPAPGDQPHPAAGGYADAATESDRPGPVLRVGLFTGATLGGVAIDPEVTVAVRAVGEILAEAGHRVAESWPDAYDDHEYLEHFIGAVAPTLVDLLGGIRAELGRPLDIQVDIEPASRYWYERGMRCSAADLAADLRWLGEYRRRMACWWASGWDLLVAPSFPKSSHVLGLPEDGGSRTRGNIDLVRTTVPFNTTGQPALTVPVTRRGDRPIGVQLVGDYYSERQLIKLGAIVAASTGSASWRPAAALGSVAGADSLVSDPSSG